MRIRFDRAIAIGSCTVFAFYALYSCVINVTAPKGVDFVSFWAAAKLALQGTPWLAYDMTAHRAVELTAGPVGGWLPFPYPPPFLLVVSPFGLLSMGWALPLWLAFGATAYAVALRHSAPFHYAFAQPAVMTNALIGQTGLLTTALFAAALQMLDRRPWLAGAMFGLLIVKPQLGLLLPLAFVAGREWRAFGGAALSVVGMIVAASALFGWRSYVAFLEHLPVQASLIRNAGVPWTEVASSFALCRWAGLSETAALLIHGLVAITAAIVTWQSWRTRHAQRGPILAAATVLMSPYLLTYDTVLLVVPMLALWHAERWRALGLVWLLALLPAIIYFLPPGIPNTAPLAAIACLIACRAGVLPDEVPHTAPPQTATA